MKTFGILALLACTLLVGCINPVRINETVLVCFSDLDEVAGFKALLADISTQYGYDYTDRSEQSARNFVRMGERGELMVTGQLVNMWLSYRGRVVFVADNLGLTAHEVVVSFPRRDTETELEHFRATVLTALDARWETRVFEGNVAVSRNTCPPI